uniref:Uncharacterized protein n=1 Tax=Parascaris univalens TaxID=6257 RepID=A0A915AZ76_PARUN
MVTTVELPTTPPPIFRYTNERAPANGPLAVPYAQVTHLFQSMINISADPCSDFYTFTCGNYNNPAGMSFEELDERNMRLIADKINDPAYRNSASSKPMQQLFHYFDTCKTAFSDWSAITRDASYVKSKLRSFQSVTRLPFPLLQQDSTDLAVPNSTTLATAIGYLEGALQTATFLTSGIDTNWRHPQSTQGYMLMVDQATLTYPASYYLKAWNLIKAEYRERVMTWMNQLTSSLNQTQLSRDVEDMLNLELRFVTELMTDANTRRNFARSYNRYTVAQASAQYPFLDWRIYLQEISAHADRSIQAVILHDDFEFNILEPAMLSKLGIYLNSGQFTARAVVNYLNYRIVDTFGSYMPAIRGKIYEKPEVRKSRVGHSRGIRRRSTSKFKLTALDAACAALTMENMPYANARVFIDALYPTSNDRLAIRKNFGRLVENVIAGFRSMIDQLNWMRISSKKGAYNKIDQLIKNIAYPDFIVDDTLLTNYYASLDIAYGDSYTTMTEKIYIFDMRTSYRTLTFNWTRRDNFNGPPAAVNAWYQPEVNSITFPAAILQQPFYDPKWPASVNYGAIGVVAGHELTHGFDDEGVQWDGTGVLYQWMDNSSYTAFRDMAECVIKEYGSFCPLPNTYEPSNCIDGSQTQGENIADNGGIHAAYRAYRNHVNLNGPEPLLNDPIMSRFTHDQLFFMGFAQVWCQQPPSDSFEHAQILIDAHSPSKYRVLGTLQNYPAFRSAFHCPRNTKYAPEKHCNVWVSTAEASYGTPKEQENSELNVPLAQQMQPNQPAKYNAYLNAVQLFKESMNMKANPCTDFYDYVCGNFDKMGSSFSITNMKNYREMAAQMELPKYNSPLTIPALAKTIKFYKACKAVRADFASNIKDGAVVLNALNEFQKTTGLQFSMVYKQGVTYAPILDKITLAKAIGHLNRKGIDTLLTAVIDTNWEAPEHYKFFFDQNTLYYSKTYYTQTAWNTIYRSYKTNTINLFNQFAALIKVTLDQITLSNDVDALLNFEKMLASSYSTSDTVRRRFKRSYNPYNISKASAQFTFIDFATYFANLAGDFEELAKYFASQEVTFLMMEPEVIGKLSSDFVDKRFDASVVANYFFYRILAEKSAFLPKPANYRPLEILSDEIFIGRQRQKSRRPVPFEEPVDEEQLQMRCASETVSEMQYANARFFVDYSYPDQASRDRIQELVGKVISNTILSFRGMLNSLQWMDDTSKRGAYRKLDNLEKNIAYPPFIVNDTLLDDYYEDLVFASTDSYFDMLSKLQAFNFRKLYKSLLYNTKVDRKDFLGAPGIVNAWYQPELNSITFPSGILRRPFYDENWPASLNYGGLGVVAGHELTHAFDDEGVQWNDVGALQQWMSNASDSGFKDMARCVVDEYNGFCPLKGTGKQPSCINGEQTQGENIADNGGIHAAWNSYQTHAALDGPDPQLPDPLFGQFTHDQLFFMNFGQVWCSPTWETTMISWKESRHENFDEDNAVNMTKCGYGDADCLRPEVNSMNVLIISPILIISRWLKPIDYA